MKKLLLTAFALTAAASVFAQGTIAFVNRSTLGTTHVYGPDPANQNLSLIGFGSNDGPVPGVTPFQADNMPLIGASGSGTPYGYQTTFAQLLDFNGTTLNAASLTPDGTITTFRSTASLLGILTLNSETLNNLASGGTTPCTLMMVAWDNSSDNYATWTSAYTAWQGGLIAAGESQIMNLPASGGGSTTTPNINPDSFNLYFIPEPSTFALAGLGLATLLAFRRRNS